MANAFSLTLGLLLACAAPPDDTAPPDVTVPALPIVCDGSDDIRLSVQSWGDTGSGAGTTW